MATRHRSLAVTACEWRAFGVADPERLADAVFDRLVPNPDPNLADFYDAVNEVVYQAYVRQASTVSMIERISSSMQFHKSGVDDEIISILSQLRTKHRDLLQLRYWDGLSETEAAEALRLSPEDFATRQAKAENRFRKRLSKRAPVLAQEPLGPIIAGAKPGKHHRYVA